MEQVQFRVQGMFEEELYDHLLRSKLCGESFQGLFVIVGGDARDELFLELFGDLFY